MPVSNKDVEVLSEALFCYYFAIYNNKKQDDYNPAVWNRIKNQSDLISFTNRTVSYTHLTLPKTRHV